MRYCERVKLSSLIVQVVNPEKITDMKNERYITLSSYGKGAHERVIKDGKYPVPFVGYRVSSGQFIYSRIDARNGAYDIIGPELDGYVVSKDFPIFDINEGRVLPQFLLKSVLSKSFISQVRSSSFGATNRMRIKEDVFESYCISLPPIEEQHKMVERLDLIESVICQRQSEIEALDQLIKARFVEMFGDPMVNPNGYETRPYGTLFELNAGGTPSKTNPEYWENGTISWIGSNLCQNEILYENDGKYISQEGYDHSSARLFPIDTVLIALVGATIGKTALLKFETSTNQNVLGVRHISESGYNPMFVYYYTQFLYQKFMNIGDGGFNMASKGFVSELPMYDIGLSAQNEFAAFAEQVDKSKVAVQKSLEKMQLLFDSLMQKYFS